MTYLYFDADEFLVTTYKFPNGWWYGCKDASDFSNAKFGYFPSNYVQVIEEYDDEGDESNRVQERIKGVYLVYDLANIYIQE